MKTYPCTINRRFWAFVIDYIFLCISMLLVMSVFEGGRLMSSWPNWLQFIVSLIIFMTFLLYWPIAEAFFHGKTVGKAMVGIRVVRTDGSPASCLHCLLRYLMLTVDLIFTLGLGGLISCMVTDRRQRIGDIMADTVVVLDNSQTSISLMDVTTGPQSDVEKEMISRIDPYLRIDRDIPPLQLAKMHRAAECDIARLRTHKAHPHLIEYMERLLSSIHIGMFSHGTNTFADMVKLTLRSIPRAVYEGRWAILTSLAVAVIAYAIGIYSQVVDPESFENLLGPHYAEVTMDNIAKGKPMGVYANTDTWDMFCEIFLNNFMVTLRLYVYGIFMFIGPVFFLLYNFVVYGVFDMFFIQQGFAVEAFVTPNEHATLELWSLIMAGGASILLGTGWLFPGRLTRLKALARSARHSILIMVSTIPVLFLAAFIESFITRHTEWPMPVKLSIIVVSFIFILVYYVMLPILAKRH